MPPAFGGFTSRHRAVTPQTSGAGWGGADDEGAGGGGGDEVGTGPGGDGGSGAGVLASARPDDADGGVGLGIITLDCTSGGAAWMPHALAPTKVADASVTNMSSALDEKDEPDEPDERERWGMA